MKTVTKERPVAKPSSGHVFRLKVHIVQRDEKGDMTERTLCGKLWDKPLPNVKQDLCEECERIYKELTTAPGGPVGDR